MVVKMRPLLNTAMALVTAGLLAGCSYFSSDETPAGVSNVLPPEKIYGSADQLLVDGAYEKAAKKFEDVDREHPYSPHARRALALAAYSYYKAGKYPEAIASGRRYTTLHQGTADAALAHHVIAMSFYDQINDPARDQSLTKKALKEFKILVRRYPQSRYAKEAHNRIRISRDVLAASEMNVGRYYLSQRNYLASINRFKTVLVEYQTTAHVEEALLRLTEAYMALGIQNEAQTAAAVLGHNFPNSKWYHDAYTLLQGSGLTPREDTGSWISRTWKSAVKSVSSVNPL